MIKHVAKVLLLHDVGKHILLFLGEVRPHVCLAKIAGTLKLLCLKYSGLIDVV